MVSCVWLALWRLRGSTGRERRGAYVVSCMWLVLWRLRGSTGRERPFRSVRVGGTTIEVPMVSCVWLALSRADGTGHSVKVKIKLSNHFQKKQPTSKRHKYFVAM